MITYILQRLVQAPVTLLAISLVVFFAVRLTGDPVDALLTDLATQEQRQQVRRELGLDQPLYIQYLRFAGNAARGNFGESPKQHRPAMEVVLLQLPATVQLTLTSVGLATFLGLGLGFLGAAKRTRFWSYLVLGLGILGQSIPTFWLGLMLILLFAVNLGWLPTSGIGSWQHLVLPSITLALYLLPQVMLLTRSSMLETLNEEYVKVARSKGLSENAVLWRHVLRNSLNPVVSAIGLNFGFFLGGAVIVETIFAWPGVGRVAAQAVFSRDLPVVQAAVFLLCGSIILTNLITDVVHVVLDPRIRVT
jgi:peptide/nickel transport system permease protein